MLQLGRGGVGETGGIRREAAAPDDTPDRVGIGQTALVRLGSLDKVR